MFLVIFFWHNYPVIGLCIIKFRGKRACSIEIMLSIPREALKPTIKRSKINLYRTDILHVDFNRYAEERCFQFKRSVTWYLFFGGLSATNRRLGSLRTIGSWAVKPTNKQFTVKKYIETQSRGSRIDYDDGTVKQG